MRQFVKINKNQVVCRVCHERMDAKDFVFGKVKCKCMRDLEQ